MAVVQDVYNLACWDLLEDGGLQLGLLTEQEFIDMLNLTITDFLLNIAAYLVVYTGTVQAGVSQYQIPDSLMRIDDVTLAGVYLDPVTMASLMREQRAWRYTPGTTTCWHADQLPPRTMEILPPPIMSSTYIPGPNEPDPPHGQFGSFSATDTSVPPVLLTPDQSGAMSWVGPELPTPVVLLTDQIPLMANDLAQAALEFGVLARVFAGDNELRDLARAQYCQQEYLEVAGLMKMITGEPEMRG